MSDRVKQQAASAIVNLARRTAARAEGNGATRHERLREAEGLYAIALDLFPDQTWAHWRGLVLMDLEDYAAAEEAFNQAASLDRTWELNGLKESVYVDFARRARELRNGRHEGATGRVDEVTGLSKDADATLPDSLASMMNAAGLTQDLQQELMALLQANAAMGEQANDEDSEVEVGREPLTVEEEEAVIEAGERFAYHLVDGRFEAAHLMLGVELKATCTPARLKQCYEEMIGYLEAPIDTVASEPPDRWEGRSHIYVRLCSDFGSEAVFLGLERVERELQVVSIEWGRP